MPILEDIREEAESDLDRTANGMAAYLEGKFDLHVTAREEVKVRFSVGEFVRDGDMWVAKIDGIVEVPAASLDEEDTV